MIIPAWIQAIATVILVMVAIKYFKYIRVLANGPYRTLLKPITEPVTDRSYLTHRFRVKNVGKYDAFEIKMFTLDTDLPTKEPIKTIANGPTTLKVNEEGDYVFKVLAPLTVNRTTGYYLYPFVIRWITEAGEKQQAIWRVKKNNYEFVVTQFEYLNLGQVKMKNKDLYHLIKK